MKKSVEVTELILPEQKDLAWDIAELVIEEVHREIFKRGKFKKYLKEIRDNVVMVALGDDGELVSTGSLCIKGLGIGRNTALILEVATVTQYRGLGAGTKVIEELESKAAQFGAAPVALDPLDKAVGFYRELGYTDNDFSLMEKQLV